MGIESISLANNEIKSKEITSKTNDFQDFNRRIENRENHEIGNEKENETNVYKENENPTYLRTINESLEGDRHPITGVPFVKKVIETLSGERIEGVFPVFESPFKAEIPEDTYLKGDKDQFRICNQQLAEKIDNDPNFAKQFTKDQIEQIHDGIKDGSAPDGYVWHHEPESGVLSLVDSDIHGKTGHTGGRFIWGGGSDFR